MKKQRIITIILLLLAVTFSTRPFAEERPELEETIEQTSEVEGRIVGAEEKIADEQKLDITEEFDSATEAIAGEEFSSYDNGTGILRTRSLEELLTEPHKLAEMPPLKLTLEDCIRIALEHNSKLAATEYGIEAAKAQLREASIGGMPIFEYEYRSAPVPHDVTHAMESFFSADWSWFHRLKIGVGIPLYSFGKISLAQDMAKSGIAAANVAQFQEKNLLVSKIRQLYYGVLLAEELGRLFTEAHNRLEKEINKRESKNDEAPADVAESADEEIYSPIDNLKMKVFLYDIQKRLAEVRQKQSLALDALRVQMGMSAGTVFTVYSDKLRPVEPNLKAFDAYMAVAEENRSDLKQLKIALDVKRSQHNLEKAKLYPDLGFGGFIEVGRTIRDVKGITATDAFNNPFNFSRAGAGFQLAGRFDFHSSFAKIDRTRSEYYKLNLEQMMARQAIRLDVREAYLRAKHAKDNLDRAREAEGHSRQILFLTQNNYDIGVGESKELVDALQMVLMTRARYFEAVFDMNSAIAVLEEKTGILPEVIQ